MNIVDNGLARCEYVCRRSRVDRKLIIHRGQANFNVEPIEVPMPFPVELKWIAQTEVRLGVRFPASFVTAMSAMNGGSVRTFVDNFGLFPFLDSSDRKRIQRTCGSIDRETASARKNAFGFPRDAVAIGENGGGDLLILMPMPDHPETLQHCVYWWDHETGEVDVVADDFDELIKS